MEGEETINEYNDAIKYATPKLYDIYVSLYIILEYTMKHTVRNMPIKNPSTPLNIKTRAIEISSPIPNIEEPDPFVPNILFFSFVFEMIPLVPVDNRHFMGCFV